MGLVFLNAQKAFDNVNWDFMIKQIEEIAFGQKFKDVLKQKPAKKQGSKLTVNLRRK